MAVDFLQGLLLGLVQAVGRHVGGVHAGRVVNHEDVVFALDRTAMHLKPHQGVNEDQHGEQLQQQQDILAQPLEESVDVQVLNALPPQKGAGHVQRPSFQLEEVEQDEQQRHQKQHGSGPGGDRNVVAERKPILQPLIDRGRQAEQMEGEQHQARQRQQ